MKQINSPEIAKQFIKGFSSCTHREVEKCPEPCPKCGEPLVFTEIGVVHMDPPRRRVKCTKCEYKEMIEIEYPQPVKELK